MFTFILLPQVVLGQDDEEMVWQQPVLMGAGWFPSLTVDQTGATHLIWGTGEGGERLGSGSLIDRLFYAKIPTDGPPSTSTDVVVTGEDAYTVRNAVGVDSNGTLHTFLRAGTRHAYIQAPSARAGDASQWINEVTLEDGYYLDLLVDSSDIIHIVSSTQSANIKELNLQNEDNKDVAASYETQSCADCADLIYQRSVDGGRIWSPIVNLSDTFGGSERQDIVEGKSNRIYVSWSEGFDWYIHQGQVEDVRFVYSDDQGQTWSEPIILDGGDIPDKEPTQFELTEFDDGALMGIWRYDREPENRIYFQISEDIGQTWTAPAPVPYIFGTDYNFLDKYELLTDHQGTVHLFAVGFDEETQIGPAVYHIEYRQSRWLRPQRIYYDPDVSNPEYIQGAVGPVNNLNITWFVRTGQSLELQPYGKSAIYFARRTGNMPDTALLSEYPPTATPYLAPTIVPMFEPTATLLPTLAPMEESADVVNRNRDQNATQALLGAVFAVSILCVGVLVLSGFRPRS